MKKLCELCGCVATVMCEADAAMLCWGCDSKVHGANFLVGKHLRVLLCHDCQAPTPWNGSGPNLVATVAFCHNCVHKKRLNNGRRCEKACGSSNGGTAPSGCDDDDDDDDDDEIENQVVPWLSLSPS
ncbi:putative zinc finger protein [Cucumis melo var. makuwa]|uniref:Putative zinc finger protein n=1 Tax=Cucumis melo var. makuwa TaxID=1194695 RepID=A0A5D3CS61_CUCMM|nr:putative zinc finger protein [Cucumis melo var. makuwa]